jgi:hypothetical protein
MFTEGDAMWAVANSVNSKLVVMLSLIVVQKLQIQDDKADFKSFLIAG